MLFSEPINEDSQPSFRPYLDFESHSTKINSIDINLCLSITSLGPLGQWPSIFLMGNENLNKELRGSAAKCEEDSFQTLLISSPYIYSVVDGWNGVGDDAKVCLSEGTHGDILRRIDDYAAAV